MDIKNKNVKIFVFLLITIVFWIVGLQIVQAVEPIWLSQQSAVLISGPGGDLTITNPNCAPDGGYGVTNRCKTISQNDNSPSVYQYDSNPQYPVYKIYAYVPSMGEAAVRYTVIENGSHTWGVTIDQSAYNNVVAYLGFTDLSPYTDVKIRISNGCVYGFWCGGLNVYMDDLNYIVR